MYYLNPNVRDLYRLFDQNERTNYIRLDLNENPAGLPEEFVRRVLESVTPQQIAQYPETEHFTKMLASYLGTDPSRICLTNGSAEAIRYVIEAFTSPGGEIVGVVPSYFMFQIYAEMYGRSFVPVPYHQDLSMDIQDIIDRISETTQLLVLLNPNNPMGNVYSDEEFMRLIDVAENQKVTVLIDEAYHYFYPKTFIDYALTHDHVFVTRTFSKLFSMAGCRLGYVVGWPEGVNMVQKLCTPHNTNFFAMLFAEEIIKTPGMIDSLISDFEQGRHYLISQLDELNYEHIGVAGNFIFIKPHTSAETLVSKMKEEKKILIKSYPNVGMLGTCLRVSIGNKAIMRQFIKALIDLDC